MRYTAFISYKHVSSTGFARQFERALKAHAKPLFKLPIKVFRDEKHLRPGVDLPQLITTALEQSEFLILLASKEAADSEWVRDELSYWCGQLQRAQQVIIVLTSGKIEISEHDETIEWSQTDALPDVLRAHLSKVPLYVDPGSRLLTPVLTAIFDKSTASVSRSGFVKRLVRGGLMTA